MAIDPVSRGGPPGGFAPPTTVRLSPLPAGQDAASTGVAAQSGIGSIGQPPTAVRSVESANAIAALESPQAASQKRSDVEDAVAKVQKVVATQANNLVFSIDDDSGRTVVKIVDSSTKETIRQIPSEEILSIAKALDKLQGLLLKQTA